MADTREQQFKELLAEHSPLISKVCYMYAPDSDTYKDLCQEVMINLWQGFLRFRGECRLSTWIYRVALNSCVSFHRSVKRHSEGAVSLDISSVAELETTDETHARNLREMYRLISALNPLDKALIMLWLDEKPYDEIAEITGLSRPNVASRLHRIKARLIEMGNS